MRALATIDTIRRIEPHPDADRLEIATVRGWRAVVAMGQFRHGQRVLFVEPDAHLSQDEARFAFLMKGGVRTAGDGFRGHVLRTVRLRGVVSQGLVLDPAQWPELDGRAGDVTALLPLRLWEPAVPEAGGIAGPFPSGVPKTDEDRVQNVGEERLAAFFAPGRVCSVTEKLDGSSVTAFAADDGTVSICGRNWLLAPGSPIHRFVIGTPQVGWLRDHPGMYLQGELIGPGVQGNRYRLAQPQWRLFSAGRIGRPDRLAMDSVPAELLPFWVPVLAPGTLPATAAGLLEAFDGMRSDLVDSGAEGVVLRSQAGGVVLDSMKVINRMLLLAAQE